MNSKERFLTSLSHARPDRIPIGLRFAPELGQRLKREMGFQNEIELRDWAGVDMATVRPRFRRSASDRYYADPTIEVTSDGLFLDMYRVPFRLVELENQSYMELAGLPPLAHVQSASKLEAWPWPTPELWDFTGIPSKLEANRDKATWGRCRGMFEICCFMRGMDNFMVDLALSPDFAGALMDHVTDGLLSLTRKTLEAGRDGYVFYEYNDDLGSQQAMLIDPRMWRDFIKPRMAKICDLIHSFGVKVRYHSCGSIRPIIPDLIEIGVDILNPIQPLATGMDPADLKKEFGRQLAFDGGIDTQLLLPKGTPEEIRVQARSYIETLGEDGGYILAGSHTLQADIPTENIIALVDEAKK